MFGRFLINATAITIFAISSFNISAAAMDVSLVCQNGISHGSTVTWYYTQSPAPPSDPPIYFEIGLSKFSGNRPPPILLFVHKKNGQTLALLSVMGKDVNKGDFTYHVDTDSYTGPLLRSDNTYQRNLEIYMIVGGQGYHGQIDYSKCVNSPPISVPVSVANEMPDLSGSKPLNMGKNEWLTVSMEPTVVMREEAAEVAIYQYYPQKTQLAPAQSAGLPYRTLKEFTAAIGITDNTSLVPVERKSVPLR